MQKGKGVTLNGATSATPSCVLLRDLALLTHETSVPQHKYMDADICPTKCQQISAQSVMLIKLGLHLLVMHMQA